MQDTKNNIQELKREANFKRYELMQKTLDRKRSDLKSLILQIIAIILSIYAFFYPILDTHFIFALITIFIPFLIIFFLGLADINLLKFTSKLKKEMNILEENLYGEKISIEEDYSILSIFLCIVVGLNTLISIIIISISPLTIIYKIISMIIITIISIYYLISLYNCLVDISKQKS